jgi:adenylosuccinate lyase
MIERYMTSGMRDIWSDVAKLHFMLHVEQAAAKAMAAEGFIPNEAAKEISDFQIDPNDALEQIPRIEAETRHDVLAFLKYLEQKIGPSGRYIHRGMTSSDVQDTVLAIQIKKAGNLVKRDVTMLLHNLEALALHHKNTPCIGRSHGIHAEVTTFGLKVLGWHQYVSRAHKLFLTALEECAYGKISGAVGTYAHMSPRVEERALWELDLKPQYPSTQIVPRDRVANLFAAMASMGTAIEVIALEIRHLMRTEVSEVAECFSKGQMGSSAMPHKKNPIVSEQLCGLNRILKGYLVPAFEDVPLWHERDISHSSVERVILPDAFHLLNYMVSKASGLVRNLEVYPERMESNLKMTLGNIFSGALLLKVSDRVGRDDAYTYVQSLVHTPSKRNLKFRVLEDPKIRNILSRDEIDECFDIGHHLRHVDDIFVRVLKNHG